VTGRGRVEMGRMEMRRGRRLDESGI